MDTHRQDELGQHPRGTLAILIIYGLVFGAAWLLLYFGGFLPRGSVHP